jgi:hypothetical protein
MINHPTLANTAMERSRLNDMRVRADLEKVRPYDALEVIAAYPIIKDRSATHMEQTVTETVLPFGMFSDLLQTYASEEVGKDSEMRAFIAERYQRNPWGAHVADLRLEAVSPEARPLTEELVSINHYRWNQSTMMDRLDKMDDLIQQVERSLNSGLYRNYILTTTSGSGEMTPAGKAVQTILKIPALDVNIPATSTVDVAPKAITLRTIESGGTTQDDLFTTGVLPYVYEQFAYNLVGNRVRFYYTELFQALAKAGFSNMIPAVITERHEAVWGEYSIRSPGDLPGLLPDVYAPYHSDAYVASGLNADGLATCLGRDKYDMWGFFTNKLRRSSTKESVINVANYLGSIGLLVYAPGATDAQRKAMGDAIASDNPKEFKGVFSDLGDIRKRIHFPLYEYIYGCSVMEVMTKACKGSVGIPIAGSFVADLDPRHREIIQTKPIDPDSPLPIDNQQAAKADWFLVPYTNMPDLPAIDNDDWEWVDVLFSSDFAMLVPAFKRQNDVKLDRPVHQFVRVGELVDGGAAENTRARRPFLGLDLMGVRAGLQADAGLILRCRFINDGIDPYTMEAKNGIATHMDGDWNLKDFVLGRPPGSTSIPLDASQTMLTSAITAADVQVL